MVAAVGVDHTHEPVQFVVRILAFPDTTVLTVDLAYYSVPRVLTRLSDLTLASVAPGISPLVKPRLPPIDFDWRVLRRNFSKVFHRQRA